MRKMIILAIFAALFYGTLWLKDAIIAQEDHFNKICQDRGMQYQSIGRGNFCVNAEGQVYTLWTK